MTVKRQEQLTRNKLMYRIHNICCSMEIGPLHFSQKHHSEIYTTTKCPLTIYHRKDSLLRKEHSFNTVKYLQYVSRRRTKVIGIILPRTTHPSNAAIHARLVNHPNTPKKENRSSSTVGGTSNANPSV